MNYRFFELTKKALYGLCLAVISGGFLSCNDRFPLDDEGNYPSWLGSSVYDQLKALGGNYELRYNDRENFRNSQDSLNFSSTNPKVMTYHSAKGLQFETVFLPYIENFSGDESDRKALYVAMTRTYRNLYVMYSSILPSPLNNIDKSLYKTTEIDEIEDL